MQNRLFFLGCSLEFLVVGRLLRLSHPNGEKQHEQDQRGNRGETHSFGSGGRFFPGGQNGTSPGGRFSPLLRLGESTLEAGGGL